MSFWCVMGDVSKVLCVFCDVFFGGLWEKQYLCVV